MAELTSWALGLAALGLVSCAWSSWKGAQVRTSALVPMESPRSIQLLGLHLEPGACLGCPLPTDVVGRTVAQARKRFATDDVVWGDRCSGRECVSWSGHQPCLTERARAAFDGAPRWSVALHLAGYHEGDAEGLVNALQGSNPGSAKMDIALFDPQQRLVTVETVSVHRAETGAATYVFGRSGPVDAAAALPRTVDSGAGPMLRRAIDASLWRLSNMTEEIHTTEGTLVLLRWAGNENNRAVDLARAGDIDQAIATWESLDTSNSRIAYNLGLAYGVRGDDRLSAKLLDIAERSRSRGISRHLLTAARSREQFRTRPRDSVWCDAGSTAPKP